MKAFRLLSVIVICGAEMSDRSGVMEKAMEFRNVVEMLPDSKFDQNVFVLVKLGQGSIHCSETFCGVHWILREIDKVKDCLHKSVTDAVFYCL